MRIGILGTRGIPNAYGGFEQFAERLSSSLAQKGHDVFVYSSHLHSYQATTWHGVNVIHCTDWENILGTAGQFIYDWNCITDARERQFDILLHLGYTSDSIWHQRWPRSAINIVNMDGLEWKRSKYSRPTQWFLKKAEGLAARYAGHLISDSIEIRKYLLRKYNRESTYIPYGADIFKNADESYLNPFHLQAGQYSLTIARLERENNIEMIIRGYLLSQNADPLVIVGSAITSFAKKMKKKYASGKIKFIGALFDKVVLNNLRYFSKIYVHGHSAGGTNPSLLEAMSCGCRIASHDNVFTRAVLENQAEYFSNARELSALINDPIDKNTLDQRKEINLEKIRSIYNWDKVVDDYEDLMITLLRKQN